MGRRPCCSKESDLNRGAWTATEDKILTEYIRAHGEGKWRHLPESAGLKRCGKSCRLRWLNYLRPGIKRGSISEEEEDLIVRLHKLLGNRWALIAGRLPGRTDNEIKNYWHTKLGKTSPAKPQPCSSESCPKSSTTHESLSEPNFAKKRRLCEPRSSSDESKTVTVVRAKATRLTRLVTMVPGLEDLRAQDKLYSQDLFDANGSSSASGEVEPPLASSGMNAEEEDCRLLDSDFGIDFDMDQCFLSDLLNCTADWIADLPYSEVEGNSFPSEEILPLSSDLESMASLIDTGDHLETWLQA